jgi:antitoxin (DNA-binding transcriptional repressor) of toxin-antitoxin stability system
MQFNIGEAKTRLSELAATSLCGEQVAIARPGIPAVRLVPKIARRRKAFRGKYNGLWSGVNCSAPMMPQADVETWEEDQVRRFYNSSVEPAS